MDVFDAVTLDQLRTLVVVAESGSFSAAARSLRRVQSAVSTAMQNLEAHLGITLWDRSRKVPVLTGQGQAVLAAARRVLAEAAALQRLSEELGAGVEPEVSLCLDAFFPLDVLIALAPAFVAKFPAVELRIDTQVMSAVSTRVLQGEATLGVVSAAGLAAGLEGEVLASVRMLPVVAPSHPLASVRGRVAQAKLAEATQIVLSERSERGVADQGVLSARTWRVADLHTKHALLRAGLGWGNLPEHLVERDLARRRLVRLAPRAWREDEHTLSLIAVYRSERALGPAHRWLCNELAARCSAHLGSAGVRRT